MSLVLLGIPLKEVKDMGLGKTLSMLALIMSSAKHSPPAHESESDYGWNKTTLIVTPLSRKSSNDDEV